MANLFKYFILCVAVILFSKSSIGQIFDPADESDYQLNIFSEHNDTIECYGTHHYSDTCFTKDGIWLIYSNTDSTMLIESVSILNKKRNGYSTTYYSENNYETVLFLESIVISRNKVFHREDMPDDLKVEKLCLSVFNGYLKYYEGGYLREMYFFEKNTFKAAYYYDCTGKLISVIEYNKKGKPIKNKKSTH